MANNVFQVKRTNVSGRTPNTTGSYVTNSQYIAAGEFALNMADGILYTSNGSAVIEVGANNTNQRITNSLTINNNKNLNFATVNTSAAVNFIQQSDDNFVMYSTNTSYGQRAIWSVFANSNSSEFSFSAPVRFNANVTALTANGTTGTAGQVLASNGSAVYWVSPGAASVNTAAQFGWTNIHTFSANVSFNGNGIGIVSNTGAVYLGGLADANWRIGRNTGATTKWVYTNNTIDIITANSNLEGMSIGLIGGNSYFETGYLGTYIASNVTIGNTTVNVSINSTAFSGTANNASNLGGVAASGYQTTAGLAANVATLTANNANFVRANNGISSNSLGVFAVAGLGTVVNSTGINVNANNGLTATAAGVFVTGNSGLIVNSTGVHVLANNGITANSTGTFVTQGTGVVVNATGVHVNAAYINTIAANSATFVLANNGIISNSTGVFVNGNNGLITNSTGVHVRANSGIVANATGTFVLANSGIIANSTGVFVNGNTGIVANSTGVFVNATYIGTISANNASFLGGVAAASYQTTAGLAANVATLTANNTSFLGGVAAASYVNTSGAYTITGVYTYTANLVVNAAIIAGGNSGTAGQVLTSNGAGNVYWSTPSTGGTSNSVYMKGGAATIGTLASEGTNIFRVNANTLNYNTTIATGENAQATGPLSVALGITLTVETGARVAIV